MRDIELKINKLKTTFLSSTFVSNLSSGGIKYYIT